MVGRAGVRELQDFGEGFWRHVAVSLDLVSDPQSEPFTLCGRIPEHRPLWKYVRVRARRARVTPAVARALHGVRATVQAAFLAGLMYCPIRMPYQAE